MAAIAGARLLDRRVRSPPQSRPTPSTVGARARWIQWPVGRGRSNSGGALPPCGGVARHHHSGRFEPHALPLQLRNSPIGLAPSKMQSSALHCAAEPPALGSTVRHPPQAHLGRRGPCLRDSRVRLRSQPSTQARSAKLVQKLQTVGNRKTAITPSW